MILQKSEACTLHAKFRHLMGAQLRVTYDRVTRVLLMQWDRGNDENEESRRISSRVDAFILL